MGSDRSPEILFEAILEMAKELGPTYSFLIFATSEVYDKVFESLRPFLKSRNVAHIDFILTPEVILMQDDPMEALRKKKNSSLVQGIKSLKKRVIQGFISCGNTGALVLASALSLPRFFQVDRPALMTFIPSVDGSISVLDVGGNVQYNASHLVCFADLGASFCRIHKNIETPKVGLLNIGIESKKGTKEHRTAYEILSQPSHRYEFIGNIEGREIFKTEFDLLVTDGFSGNILLKTIEGAGEYVIQIVKEELKKNKVSHTEELFKQLKKRLSYTEYPGAVLLGLDGLVMKCHGDASPNALKKSIETAISFIQKSLIDRMKKEMLSLSR